MNGLRKLVIGFCLVLLLIGMSTQAEAKKSKKGRARRYYPPVTHPVLLWTRTLKSNSDNEARRVAAFKLSAYTQPIFQEEVVSTLIGCLNDPDIKIRVWCTKAIGRAKSPANAEKIRKTLIALYESEPALRNSIVRTFMTRRENHSNVQDTLLATATETDDTDELLVLCDYFEALGTPSTSLVSSFTSIYEKQTNVKAKRGIIKVLTEKAEGQDKVIALFGECAQDRDTPLALTCLSGLQAQAKMDTRAWTAISKTIESSDEDVLLATFDVISALPETSNIQTASRIIALIEDNEDPAFLERAVLAVGSCGDQSEPIVQSLIKILEKPKQDDAVRIAAALALGKQSASFPERPRISLNQCIKTSSSTSMKSACQLSLKELEARHVASSAKVPIPFPAGK